MDRLAESEFILIQEIAKSPTRTQRELSTSVGLSLGMTNLLIKRLARKGLIKVTQLDWNRTQYILTIKGGLEKARKMYDYTIYTVRIFRQIEDNITQALRAEYAAGRRRFTLVAEAELLELIRESVERLALPDSTFAFSEDYDRLGDADLVLTATKSPPPARAGCRFVSLVDFDNISFRLR